MEVEAKFALLEQISAERIEAIDWRPLALGQRQIIDQHDTSFDTPERTLSHAYHAVRLREGGTHTVVTLKGPGTVNDGVHSREELEEPTNDHSPPGWPAPIQARLHELIGAAATTSLTPLLAVHNLRRIWPLLHEHQVIGEVALDEGTITAGERSMLMHELEIELKGGTDADLTIVSALVRQQLPAQPEARTKFERGLRLLMEQS